MASEQPPPAPEQPPPTVAATADQPSPTSQQPPPAAATEIDNSESDHAAANAVFDTAELRESILIHLPVKMLFTSQRVNKSWQATIRDSKEIRQKMFLRAKEASVGIRRVRCDESHQDDNEEDNMSASDDGIDAIEAFHLKDVVPGESYSLQATINPLLSVTSVDETTDLRERAYCGELAVFANPFLLSNVRSGEELRATDLGSDDHASYLGMFLCQPPAKAVKLRFGGHIQMVANDLGVTLGDVVAACNRTIPWPDFVKYMKCFGYDPSAPFAGLFDVKFAGALFNAELGDAVVFCSPDDAALLEHGAELLEHDGEYDDDGELENDEDLLDNDEEWGDDQEWEDGEEREDGEGMEGDGEDCNDLSH